MILKPRPSFTHAGLESDGRYPIGRRDILPPNPDRLRLNRRSAIVTNPDSRKPGAVTATEPLRRRNASEVSNRGAQGTYSQSTRPREREPKSKCVGLLLTSGAYGVEAVHGAKRWCGGAARNSHSASAQCAKFAVAEAHKWRRESCNGGVGPGVVWWRSTPEWLSRHRSQAQMR
jgi:hypothetical protein